MTRSSTTTKGFGVPDVPMPHQFEVRIPQARTAPVEIWEDFGAAAQDTANAKLCRVEVPRDTWRKVSDGLKKHLNRRLKEKGIKASRFATGENKVERLLGRELAVLAWAIEDATVTEAAIAFTRWSSHRPEELWWLFQQIDRDGGEWDSPKTGWRAAIRHALIREGDVQEIRPKRARPVLKDVTPELPDLFKNT